MNSSLIPVTVLVTVGLNEIDQSIAGKSGAATYVKPIVAGFALGIGLYAVDALSPELGTTFCILLVTTSVVLKGTPVFKKLGIKGGIIG